MNEAQIVADFMLPQVLRMNKVSSNSEGVM